MAEINLGGSPTYTIPLDNLDLAYLSKYVSSPRESKCPQWTKKWLEGESEYYQVKIITRDNNNEDCYSELADTYECHICNVNVPITCYQRHNESVQHETFRKIYQKVLERVAKQIDVNTKNIDHDINEDEYYCEPCCNIIKIKNKQKHERSDYHGKSLKEISVIKEFYKIFKENKLNDDTEVSEVKREDCDLNDDSEVSEVKREECDDKNNNNLKTCEILDSDDDYFDEESSLPEAPEELIRYQSHIEFKNESFEEYLKNMIQKHNLKVSLPAVDGEFMLITSPNGDTVKVSRQHFHSYIGIKNNIYCQLCNMWISEDTRPHDVTETHVKNIFKPLNDNFARRVSTVSSHCIPCNEVIVTGSDHHTLDDNHKMIIKKTQIPKTHKTFCKDCNIYIDILNYSVHLISKKHINALMKENSMQSTGNDDTFCKLCNVTVPKYALQYHINSKLHSTKKSNNDESINLASEINDRTKVPIKTINKNNAPTETNHKNNNPIAAEIKVTQFCEVCKVKVPSGGMKIHVAGKPHKTRYAQLNSGHKNVIKANENKVKIAANNCTVANTVRSGSSSILDDSIVSTSTASNSNKTDEENDKINSYYVLTEFVDKNKTKVRCKICSVNIFYVNRNVIEHMEGRNHEIAENELLHFHCISRESNGFICKCCDVKTAEYLDHINSKGHTLKFQETRRPDKNEMRKYVYEENVNSPISRCHREMYRNLLKHNGILKLDDAIHYCGMCQIKLGRISEIDHVLGERHRTEFEKHSKIASLLEQFN